MDVNQAALHAKKQNNKKTKNLSAQPLGVADVFPVQAWGNSSATFQHMVGPHEGIIMLYASVVVWLRHISRRLPGPRQEMRDLLQGEESSLSLPAPTLS